jgi:hypothetical protein
MNEVPRMSRTTWAFMVVMLVVAAPAWAELNVRALVPMVAAPPGSSVVVEALLENASNDVVYLGSVSVDLPIGFTGTDPFAEFLAAAPDSLLPGESWEGPVLRLTVAPDAPVADVHQVRIDFHGGVNPYDESTLAEFAFALNDPAVLVSVPADGRPAAANLQLRASPNPTHGLTWITFELATARDVEVGVYDVRGASVRSLLRERRKAGLQTVRWDGRNADGARAPAGIYFVRVIAGDVLRYTKVVQLK